jgi:hypothetical protein
MEKGLLAIAITDHDTINGLPEALETGRRYGYEVVPGIEIGVMDEPEEDLIDVDILGYFIDPENDALNNALAKIRSSRWNWLTLQVLALEMEYKINIPIDKVLKEVGHSPTPRRPHIYRTIEKLHPGKISRDDFYFMTDHGGKLFVEKQYELGIEQCIRLIAQAGGKAALAHPEDYPKITDKDKMVQTAIQAGISAIEVYYTYRHNRLKCSLIEQERIIDKYKGIADRSGLIAVGGSDFHGSTKPSIELGMPGVPYSCLERLKGYSDLRMDSAV